MAPRPTNAKRSANGTKQPKNNSRRPLAPYQGFGPISRGTVIQAALGLPEHMTFKHKYAIVRTCQSVSGVPFTKQFLVNSLYSPETSGGHQPMYFDQMTALYDQYQVLRSKFTARVVKGSVDTPDVPAAALVYLEDDTSVPGSSNIQASLEQGRNVSVIGTGDGTVKISQIWDASSVFPDPIGNVNLIAVPSANPAELMYFTFQIQALDQAATATTYVMFEIEYETLWTERKPLSTS